MSEAKRRARRLTRLRQHTALVGRLARESGGNVLPLAAAATLVLASLVGGGVDMARAYKAERRLQAACDAGVLAGRRAVGTNGFDSAVQTQADSYFEANFDEGDQGVVDTAFAPTSPDNGNTVNGAASAKLNTIIMKVFGFDVIDLGVNCSASMGVGNSDVVFVLDTTGSMLWAPDGTSWGVDEEDTRLFALQQAMKSFYDTVAASVSGGNARVRYGFVPYSSAINVGGILADLDASYIANSVTVQSRQPVNWSAVVDTWTETGAPTQAEMGDWERINTKYNSQTSCNNNKPANSTNWTSDGSPSTSSQTYFDPAREQRVTATGSSQRYAKNEYQCAYYEGWYSSGWYVYRRQTTRYITSYTYQARNPIPVTAYGATYSDWLYRPVTYDTSTFKTFVQTPALVSSSSGRTRYANETWAGCIQERQTTPASSFSFESLATGITPAAALDLDIDAAPTSDPATQWKPLWEDVAYRRSTQDASLSGNSNPADAYCPDAAQILSEMDEADFDEYADGLDAEGSTYHDIGLLWGARISSPTGIFTDNVNEEPDNGGTVSRHLIFMTDGELAPSTTINSTYGIEYLDRRITTTGDSGDQWNHHRARFLAVCDAIKARGIRLWVIAFGTSLSSDLSSCASPNSSFESDDADELDETFQEIAKQVGELRVTQ